MFEHILAKEKFMPDEVIMVGDSIESDLIASQKAGIKGILVDRNNKREYPNKILDLTQICGQLQE
jgi:FMN phosphatase YigB (HAD superfamily)